MNVEGLFFLILVGLLGGVIALIADRLGRTLGKKRLTWMKMRPRRTAEVLTFIAGFLIPIGTFFIVMAFSQGVREWIADAPGIIRQRDQLNSEVKRDKLALDAAKEVLATTQRQLGDTTTNLHDLAARSKSLQNQVRQQTAALNRRTADLNAALARYNAVDAQYRSTKDRYDKAQKDYASVHKDYIELQKTLAEDKKTYDKLNRDYSVLTTDREKAEKEVRTDENKLSDLNQQLLAKESDLAKVKGQFEQAQDDLKLATDDIDQARLALEQVRTQRNNYSELGTKFLLEPVIFNVGEELARVPIPAGVSREEAANYLDGLIDRASEVAASRGAKRSSEASDRAAGFLPVTIFDQDRPMGIKSPAQQFNECVDEIVAAKSASVILAKSQYNTVRDVFVSLQIERRDNPLVYKNNQAIAETLIRGSDSDVQIYDEITSFVKDKVAESAKAHKMVPVAGSQETLGEVSPGALLKVIEDLRTYGRTAHLVAVASKDTYAGDPLLLDLRLRP